MAWSTSTCDLLIGLRAHPEDVGAALGDLAAGREGDQRNAGGLGRRAGGLALALEQRTDDGHDALVLRPARAPPPPRAPGAPPSRESTSRTSAPGPVVRELVEDARREQDAVQRLVAEAREASRRGAARRPASLRRRPSPAAPRCIASAKVGSSQRFAGPGAPKLDAFAHELEAPARCPAPVAASPPASRPSRRARRRLPRGRGPPGAAAGGRRGSRDRSDRWPGRRCGSSSWAISSSISTSMKATASSSGSITRSRASHRSLATESGAALARTR